MLNDEAPPPAPAIFASDDWDWRAATRDNLIPRVPTGANATGPAWIWCRRCRRVYQRRNTHAEPKADYYVECCSYRDCDGTLVQDGHRYTAMRARAGADWPEEPVAGEHYILGAPLPDTREAEYLAAGRKLPEDELPPDPLTHYWERSIGAPLSVLLIVLMVTTAVGAVLRVGLLLLPLVGYQVVGLPACGLPILVASSVLSLIFLRGIWNWKRWGVVGAVVMTVIGFILDRASKAPILVDMIGALVLVLLIVLVVPLWSRME